MPYTLGQAARASGKSKATIHRAVKSGRLSAARTDSGGWLIDPAELHRVFPLGVSGNGARDGSRDDLQPLTNGMARFEETALLRERIAEQAETIRDLRARLDTEAEERRRVQERLTALLTHRQTGSVPSVQRVVTESPQPWWRRWFR